MGANEWGLCAGNEAVWTREEDKCDNGVERLLGNYADLSYINGSATTSYSNEHIKVSIELTPSNNIS